MAYRAGCGPALAKLAGIEPGGPRITCDGCGVITTITDYPPKWFLAGKPQPGWLLERDETTDPITRLDWCPRCKGARIADVRAGGAR